MADAIANYFAALERLKKRGARINNDTVAVEAGNKEGAIKNSRPQHKALIDAIAAASAAQAAIKDEPESRARRLKEEKKDLRRLLDESIAREIALLDEVFSLRAQLDAINSGKVTRLRVKGP